METIPAAGGFDLSSIAPTASRFHILERRPSFTSAA